MRDLIATYSADDPALTRRIVVIGPTTAISSGSGSWGSAIIDNRSTETLSNNERDWQGSAELKALADEIRREVKHAAQWILRIGMRLRFDPPDLMPVTRRGHYWKVLRCNRFGIGLRMGDAK